MSLCIGVNNMVDNLLDLYSFEELKNLLLGYTIYTTNTGFFRVTKDFSVSGLKYKKGDILFIIDSDSGEPKSILINRKMRQHNSFLCVERIKDTNLRVLLSDRCWYFIGYHRKYYEPLTIHQFLYTGYKGETK